MSDHDQGTGKGRHSLDAENVRPFSSRGDYQSVYDLIVELPSYRRAMDLHMPSIRSIKTSGPIITDASGGGIMSAEARRVRHDADVYLFDVNPAMAEQARKHGVPNGADGRWLTAPPTVRRVHEGLGGILLQCLARPQQVRTVSRARQRRLPRDT